LYLSHTNTHAHLNGIMSVSINTQNIIKNEFIFQLQHGIFFAFNTSLPRSNYVHYVPVPSESEVKDRDVYLRVGNRLSLRACLQYCATPYRRSSLVQLLLRSRRHTNMCIVCYATRVVPGTWLFSATTATANRNGGRTSWGREATQEQFWVRHCESIYIRYEWTRPVL